MYDSDRKVFWDNVHTAERHDGGGLTGLHLQDYLEAFKIQDIYAKASTILEIGVGMGYVVKEAAADKKYVSAVDISTAGLQQVMPYVCNAWLPTEYESIPSNTFDLVFSKTVSLHLTNEELEDQIRNVLRILKPTGIFAMEFYDRPNYQGEPCFKAGTLYRSLDFVGALVKKYGGEIPHRTERLYPGIVPPIYGWCLWIKRHYESRPE